MLFTRVIAVITIALAAPFLPYPRPAVKDVAPPNDCVRYYKAECRNWRLAMWLPSIGEAFELPRGAHATTIPFSDGFIYQDVLPKGRAWNAAEGGPRLGTDFVYGNAGPPRGTVVYDANQHIAFYGQGCCAWHSTVLAAMVPPPPLAVQNASLGNIKTVHELALGQTQERVERIYGAATPFAIRNMPNVSMLAYKHIIAGTCEQDERIAFLHDRVIYIELTDGC